MPSGSRPLDFSSTSGKSSGAAAPMPKLLRSLNATMRPGGWIALLIVMATAAVALPRALESRFVSKRRAAFALRRAQAHLASHQIEPARAEFAAALQLEPGDLVARRELGEMELGLGNTELAFLDYESLTEMHPEESEGWVKLAELMVKSAQLEAPEALLDKAIELDPHRLDARLMRSNIRLRLGRYYGGVQDAQAAVPASAGDVDSWVLLVRSVTRSQGTEAGRQVAGQAIAAVGEQPPLVALRAGLGRGQRRHRPRQRPPDRDAPSSAHSNSAGIEVVY